MRKIHVEEVQKKVEEMLLKANRTLPSDVKRALIAANERETNEHAKFMLGQILENAEIAESNNWPTCQDTGMAVVFLDIGQDVMFTGGSLEDAVNQGVRDAYKVGRLRNSVADPLTRENTHDNTPAVIHYSIVEGDTVEISVAPKGFGSENMSQSHMLNPTASADDILEVVVQTVKDAGGKPCPPIILGIGIGGTLDKAALIAKRALLRDIDVSSTRSDVAELEERILEEVNKLNIGAQGLGGINTALGVSIETFPTHIAGLPVVINFQCHAARHVSEVI